MDKAAARVQHVAAEEAEALARLRIAQAQAEAAERARVREAFRRAEQEQAARQARREAEEVRQARRAQRRQRVERAWAKRRGLVAVAPMMGASAGVALPAQWTFYGQVTGSGLAGVVIAVMVEGGTWMGAALESAAIDARQPVGRYRALTWGLAGIAAGVNVAHGLGTGGWQVAVVFGLASLLGPISWAAYSHLRSGTVSGRTAEDFRRAAWRRVWHPVLSWRAADLRATTACGLDPEQAWRQVWDERRGRRGRTRRGRQQPSIPSRVEEPTAPVEVDRGTVEACAVEVPDRGRVEAVSVESGRAEARAVRALTSARRGRDEAQVRVELVTALREGRLTVSSSAEEVRRVLGMAWRTARPVAGAPGRAG
jgi:hypothetical protein